MGETTEEYMTYVTWKIRVKGITEQILGSCTLYYSQCGTLVLSKTLLLVVYAKPRTL